MHREYQSGWRITVYPKGHLLAQLRDLLLTSFVICTWRSTVQLLLIWSVT